MKLSWPRFDATDLLFGPHEARREEQHLSPWLKGPGRHESRQHRASEELSVVPEGHDDRAGFTYRWFSRKSGEIAASTSCIPLFINSEMVIRVSQQRRAPKGQPLLESSPQDVSSWGRTPSTISVPTSTARRERLWTAYEVDGSELPDG